MSYTPGANTSSATRRRVTVLGDGTLRKNQNYIADITKRLSDLGASQPHRFTVTEIEEMQNIVIYSITGAHITMELVDALDREFPGVVYNSKSQTLRIPIDPQYAGDRQSVSSSVAAQTEATVMVAGGLVLVACATALSWTG